MMSGSTSSASAGSGKLRQLALRQSPHFARRATRRRNIATLRVVHHHPVGIKAPSQRPDRPLHALDPASRQPIAIPAVVERNHLVQQHAVKRIAIAAVVNIQIGVRSPLSDREPVLARRKLRPTSHPAPKDSGRRSAPLSCRSCPLASSGRRGLFSHTSTPCTRCRPTLMS